MARYEHLPIYRDAFHQTDKQAGLLALRNHLEELLLLTALPRKPAPLKV